MNLPDDNPFRSPQVKDEESNNAGPAGRRFVDFRAPLLGCVFGGCGGPLLVMGLVILLGGGMGSPVFWPLISIVSGGIGLFIGLCVLASRTAQSD